MPDWVLYFMKDIREIWNGITFASFARAGFFGIWTLLLFLPLHGIDRRGEITLMMYALFIIFAGVTLVIVIPMKYTNAEYTTADQVIMVVLMAAISQFRWTFLDDSVVDKFGTGIELDFPNEEQGKGKAS